MVQPFVKVLSVNAPKPPPVALMIPLISALFAYRFPFSLTLNELVSSVGPVPLDQKTLSVNMDGLLIPAVLFSIPSLDIEIYPAAEFKDIFP